MLFVFEGPAWGSGLGFCLTSTGVSRAIVAEAISLYFLPVQLY